MTTPNKLLGRLYRKVISENVPLKYIKLDNSGNVETYGSVIKRLRNEGRPLGEISNLNPELNPENVAMLYYNISDLSTRNEVINEISSFYKEKSLAKSDVLSDYKVWIEDYNKTLEQDLFTANSIIDRIEAINATNVKELTLSPVRYTYRTRSTYPKMIIRETGEIKTPTVEDAIDLFNFAIPSYDVPFIQYNSFENTLDEEILTDVGNWYKIFKGDTSNPVPLDVVIQSKTDTKNKNTIYMTVWIGKQYNKLLREYYIPVSYDLTNNKLIFSMPSKEEDTVTLILTRIKTCLNLQIAEHEIYDENMGAEFMIYNFKIDHNLLSYVILNDDMFKLFLYVDERSKPAALKKVHRIKYKTFPKDSKKDDLLKSLAWITIHNVEVSTIEVLPVQSKTPDDSIKLDSGSNYIRIDILKAMDKNIITEMYSIIPRLIHIYISKLSTYKNNINSYLTYDIFASKEEKKVEPKEKKSQDRGIFNLRQLAKGLIDEGYARTCLCHRHPIIIPQEEVPEWSVKTFIYKGVTRTRTVMPFPPDNPKWWFVCIKKDHPFPGIMINRGDNSTNYPHIPCCFKTPQMENYSGKLYDEVYNGNPRKRTNREQAVLATNKLLGSQRLGELPGIVVQLLSKYDEDAVAGITFYRQGVPTSPSSLLHCIFEALQHQDYLYNRDNLGNLTPKTDEDKEKYIRTFRRGLLTEAKVDLDVARQELYDFSKHEIAELFTNPDVFMDPALYYRILEELFNINLYVFTTPKNNEGSFAMVELPRNKLFHTRRYNPSRYSVIIFKYWEDAAIPQCEVIVSYDTEDSVITSRVYNPRMAEILHDVIIKTTNTMIWSIDPNNLRITTRKNLYNSINSYEILRQPDINGVPTRKITGQFIDGYGKCRGFVFPYEENDVTVIIHPAQPENLPTLVQMNRGTSIDVVFKLFGNSPTFISRNEASLIDGLWYRVLDVDEGFYLPIIPVLDDIRLADVPIGSKNPFFTDGKNLVRRLTELNKINKIILQIIQWLFLKSGMSIKDFIENYMKVRFMPNQRIDSETVYNIRRVPRKFPIINSFTDSINYIQSVLPTLVENGKIMLYSKKFAEGIVYFLKEYINSVDISREELPVNIRGKFASEYDFNQYANTVIFIKESDMRTWLYSKHHLGIEYTSIRKKIDFSDNIVHEPFLYQDPSGRFYIIQNVSNFEFRRAINCSYSWYAKKINYGYDTQEYPEDVLPSYILYGISAGNIPEPIKDKSNGDPNFLRILSYGEGQYASMLPLQ